jgi:hypothetical protein
MKTTSLSVRVSDEDAAFLAGLSVPDAQTPSEKLRHLIHAERDRQRRARDPVDARDMMREILQPARRAILTLERQTGLRSELLARIYDRLTELAGEAWAGPTEDDEQSLREFEAQIMISAFAFVSEVLEIGLTRRSRCYDPEEYDRHASQVLELLTVLNAAKQK